MESERNRSRQEKGIENLQASNPHQTKSAGTSVLRFVNFQLSEDFPQEEGDNCQFTLLAVAFVLFNREKKGVSSDDSIRRKVK